MKVTFRVDATLQLGTGHLMRCLTLAEWLREEGATCQFISSSNPLNQLITDRGFELHRIALPEHDQTEFSDAEYSLAAMPAESDWVVVDNYSLGERWERSIRPACRFVAAIDDLADRRHDVDLLIDQNQLPDALTRYEHLVESKTERLLGAKYALLREGFARNGRSDRDGRLQRILIGFGGTDPTNETGKALEAINSLEWHNRHIDVVAGSLHPNLSDLKRYCEPHPQWHLHIDTNQIAGLMRDADLAIGACGISTWERCASSLPSVVVTTADNQHPLALAIAENGAGIWLGDGITTSTDDLRRALKVLDRAPHTLISMSRQAAAMCDGRGVSRVGRRLFARLLTLRPATAEDEKPMLVWRNHPLVLAFSGNGKPIPEARHHEWYSSVLADKSRVLLIAESMEQPVGVLRFDNIDLAETEVSIFLQPQAMGKQWGLPVLQSGLNWLSTHSAVTRVIARIHPDNHASLQIFSAAGFTPGNQTWHCTLQKGHRP